MKWFTSKTQTPETPPVPNPQPEPRSYSHIQDLCGGFMEANDAIAEYSFSKTIPANSPPEWDWEYIIEHYLTSSMRTSYLLRKFLQLLAQEPDSETRKAIAEAMSRAFDLRR